MEALVHVCIVERHGCGGFPGQEGCQQQDERQVGDIFLKSPQEKEVHDPNDGLQEVDHEDQRGDIDELGGEVPGIASIEYIEE